MKGLLLRTLECSAWDLTLDLEILLSRHHSKKTKRGPLADGVPLPEGERVRSL